MSAIAKLGNFQFQDDEINLVKVDYSTRYSGRNKKLYKVVTMQCYGELIHNGADEINAAANDVYNALQTDGLDFTYTVNGFLVHQLLNSGDCVTGTKVLNHSFPQGGPEQFATTRSVAFTLQATYDTPEDDLVSWTEEIEIIGTGGPKFFVVDTAFGPIAIYTSIATAQYYSQVGEAVGYLHYPDPPGPCDPAGEFQDRRRIGRKGGRNLGNGLRFFTRKWSYFMGRSVIDFGPADFVPISQ